MEKGKFELSRRQVLRYGMMSGAFLIGSRAFSWAQLCPPEMHLPEPSNCGIQEVWAHTPFIVNPFVDPLPVPPALRPGFRQRVQGGNLANWTVRKWTNASGACQLSAHSVNPVLMGDGMQDSYGASHSVTPAHINAGLPGAADFPLAATPLLYHIRLQVALHPFTSSRVRPIDRNGNFMTQAELDALGVNITLDGNGEAALPPSTIYGFNGTFPGPMINVDYGRPVIVRFECDLDLNPNNYGTGDFGVPQFLCHLHNGHTAPESDGNPHYMQHNEGGYIGGDYVDNLYLNWPAAGDPSEMQSFLWFHDHRMHHTGANVYKGMAGLFPMYDPGVEDPANPGSLLPGTGLDPGDERPDPVNRPNSLRLPGRRVDNGDGSFDVKYDIPMALYDCRLDDGDTPHADFRIGDELIIGDQPPVPPGGIDTNTCGATHPHEWGKTFFRYHPNHGFVGDLFTVNCTAFPVFNVFKRRYRFRFLGASIARIYELALMTSAAGPLPTPGIQGQWQIPDGAVWRPNGSPAMTQIASMGGLLPNPLLRDLIQIWPATRREVVVDFTDVPEGTVLYLTNVLEMTDGRKPIWNDPNKLLGYKVPMVKIVVGGLPPEADQSIMPTPATPLRPMPVIPSPAEMALLPHREFTLSRSGQFGDASQWLINSLPFDPTQALTELQGPGNPVDPVTGLGVGNPIQNGPGEVWTVRNGGGGWVHPMHMHQEEHTVIGRVGGTNPHPDDTGKEDVANLDEGEAVTFFRRFRTFTGQYVAHCHNLAHEDHNMMFGWKIDPTPGTPQLEAPRAFRDQFSMKANTEAVIPVLANDTTFDGRPLAGPDGKPLFAEGIVEIALTGNAPFNGRADHLLDHSGIRYIPDLNFSGTDSFAYTVSLRPDPTKPEEVYTSKPALVTITVVSDDAAVANDDVYSMEMNTVGVIPVLANDTFQGQPLTTVDALTIVGNAPFNGRVVVNGDHTITYTPDADFTGTNTFSYTITVGGITSLPATVTVTVNATTPTTHILVVKRAIVNVRGKQTATRGPRWIIQGTGAVPKAVVTIQADGAAVATVKANRRGIWRYSGRAVPGMTNPSTITVSSPGAVPLTVPCTVYR